MSFLDIILGCLLIYAVYNGIKNGLFVELASLLALVLGIFMAIKFSGYIKTILENNVTWSPKVISVSSFLLTFIIVVVCIHLLAKVFTNIASFAYLGWLNKLAGAGFSVLKTVLALSIVISLFQKININNLLVEQKTLDNSIFYNPIKDIAAIVYPSLEKLFTENIGKLKTK